MKNDKFWYTKRITKLKQKMKSKILIFIFVLILGTVCGALVFNARTIGDINIEIVTISDSAIDDAQSSEVLIAYFSRTGNTREVAKQIQAATGGDLFAIEPVVPCPEDYDECKKVASKQKEENARPEVTDTVDNMDDYDVVFVGYPLWLSTMPMHMFTFLDAHDFAGKTVIPFSTSGSGKVGQSEEDMAKSLPSATVLEGLVIKGDEVGDSNEKVLEWIDQLNVQF